jgi:carbamoylphosphate synthase small subunit
MGVSHIAIGLVSFLNKNGMKTIYEEKNHNGIVSTLYHENTNVKQTNGIYNLNHFEAIPEYDKTIYIDKTPYDVIVLDCGSDTTISKEFKTADIRIVILGTKEWEMQNTRSCISALKDIDKH